MRIPSRQVSPRPLLSLPRLTPCLAPSRATAALLLCCLSIPGFALSGCGKSGQSGQSSKSKSSDSKSGGSGANSGAKTYVSDKKGSAKSGPDAPLPMGADTSNGKASAASDAGTPAASKGLPLMNPGVTAPPHQPQKAH